MWANHELRAGASIVRRRLKARIIIRLMSSLGIAIDVVVFVNFILINQKIMTLKRRITPGKDEFIPRVKGLSALA
ncbi:hypothetical protein CEW82_00530 [Lactiplantibacillus pentosus]|nr:hypothetical protein CEW82_00530 [Lactiplantibacillus pentosus]